MSVVLRECHVGDRDYLLRAIEALHDYVVDLDPIQRLRKMPGYVESEYHEITQTTAKQSGKIIIADDGGKPVGFVAGFTTTQSDNNLLSVIPSKLGVISDLYVDELYRKQQVGKKLMMKIEAHLKSLDCDAIWIDIVAFNKNAHRFYNQMGYDDREIGLIKRI